MVRGSKKKPSSDSNAKNAKTSHTQKASQSAKTAQHASTKFKSDLANYKKTASTIHNNSKLPTVKSSSSKTHRHVAKKAPILTKTGSTKTVFNSEQKQLIKDTKVPLSGIPKLNPNKIRFGYNASTATEPELQHIRRRQLRQSVQSLSSPIGKSSSSSDEDTPLSMTTRAVKKQLSRNVQNKDQSAMEAAVSCIDARADNTELSVESTASITSGKGLKMVIRRQSTGSTVSHKTVDVTPDNTEGKDDSANVTDALNGSQTGDTRILGQNGNFVESDISETDLAEPVGTAEDRNKDCSPNQAGSNTMKEDGRFDVAA